MNIKEQKDKRIGAEVKIEKIKIELNKIRVFVCVPAVGKTYLSKKYENIIDMDIVRAKYKYNENWTEEDCEFYKGNRPGSVRHDTNEYIAKKMDEYLQDDDKILLFAPNPEIVDIIVGKNIPYCLVYHDLNCIEEIKERMRARGNQENFIKSMTDPCERFFKENSLDNRPSAKVILSKGEYLSDLIVPLFKDKIKEKP